MANKVLTSSLKPGMVITSQRTTTRVYNFGDRFDGHVKSFPMKGKAIVLTELTPVCLKMKKFRYDSTSKTYDSYDGMYNTNIVVLLHYKHGIVMYLTRRPLTDFKWRLLKETCPIPQNLSV